MRKLLYNLLRRVATPIGVGMGCVVLMILVFEIAVLVVPRSFLHVVMFVVPVIVGALAGLALVFLSRDLLAVWLVVATMFLHALCVELMSPGVYAFMAADSPARHHWSIAFRDAVFIGFGLLSVWSGFKIGKVGSANRRDVEDGAGGVDGSAGRGAS